MRIDRFDANQKVLKDKYLLHAAYQASSSKANDLLQGGSHPSTIGDDFVVYVDDVNLPSAIVGYRDGGEWYNADGLKISDPLLLAEVAGGKIAPYLIDPDLCRQEVRLMLQKYLKTILQKQYLCLE